MSGVGMGVLKVEAEAECCSVCGGGGELLTPEEHDAAAPPHLAPLRTMLLQLNTNKVVPEGRLCSGCAHRAAEAYEFSQALGARAAPPLGEKIRALRRRLHELTQKIDVFIVVGGPGAGGAGAAYSEDDIIMVEKEALAAAAAADDEELEHARNAKGDPVYQCSVCPLSFQRASELRAHVVAHPADASHSCWTCGAQFAARHALREHAAQHAALQHATCNLCDTHFQCQSELRRHEASCPSLCPACGEAFASRGELSLHCARAHGRGGAAPHVCAACFRACASAALLSAHMLRHRQARQFVCGYGACVLRFGTRANLMAHIRKAHAAELPAEPEPQPQPEPDAPPNTCQQCGRTFASPAALKRHARVHRDHTKTQEPAAAAEGDGMQWEGGAAGGPAGAEAGEEGEVEYLEVEALEDAEGEFIVQQYEHDAQY